MFASYKSTGLVVVHQYQLLDITPPFEALVHEFSGLFVPEINILCTPSPIELILGTGDRALSR